ncbi:MAG: J domain-containing protein [Stappiaceae bacterium]
MTNKSNIFDSIRVKPSKDKAKREKHPDCEWEGCPNPGSHKAPKGRGREGQFFRFCVNHVREYNKSYNYFQGMDDTQLRSYQKDALTGHRPTWKMGVNKSTMESQGRRPGEWSKEANDPFELLDEDEPQKNTAASRQRRHLVTAQKHAFETLNLNYSADAPEIKARYKELVKKHHPDANGGDSSLEDRLRQIIQAYNVLKKAGFC